MKSFPKTVIFTLVFLGIVETIWVLFGIAVIGGWHPAFPREPFFRYGIGITAIIAGLLMGGLTYLLIKGKKYALWFLLTGLSAFSIATFFDQIGWIDLLVLVITLVPLVFMVKDLSWYKKSH